VIGLAQAIVRRLDHRKRRGTTYGVWYERVNKTTIYLPDELQRRIKEVARGTGRRPAELIRAAIEEFLQAQDRPLPRSLGAGEDTELAARDSEDWLRGQWHRR
jgi:Arc/MetJ-type ribon-helix-helix transcriptional regulator